ncbi:MAG: hypothetical protein ABI193_17775 [Minicystis sp.]
MASESENEAPAPVETASTETASIEAASKERLDEEGLPLDRPPTLDDVRGTEGGGRLIAVGCTGLVVLLVLGFWALRALVFH